MGKWVGSLGKMMNSDLRERERRKLKREIGFCILAAAGFGFLCKKWVIKIKTRVCDLALKNKTARADYPFRPSGPRQFPAISTTFRDKVGTLSDSK